MLVNMENRVNPANVFQSGFNKIKIKKVVWVLHVSKKLPARRKCPDTDRDLMSLGDQLKKFYVFLQCRRSIITKAD